MECPLCGAAVMHAQWLIPLQLPPPGSHLEMVKRDVIQAAYWAFSTAGKSLEDYLRTREGQPYARFWSVVEVQQADRHVIGNPLQP